MPDLDNPFARLALACLVIGAGAATAAIYGLPWLWSLVKPTLRSLVG